MSTARPDGPQPGSQPKSGTTDTGAPSGLAPGAGLPLVPGPPASILPSPQPSLKFLYGSRNRFGCALVLVGVVITFTGIFGPFWPLALLGLYLVGVLVAPSHRRHDLWSNAHVVDVRRAMTSQTQAMSARLPPEVMAKVTNIQSMILSLLPRAEQLPAGSEDLYVLHATALEYLPNALEAYLNLPRAYATLHPVDGGETAKSVLLDQLTLLESKMGEISDDIANQDFDRLLANGRFLREKFGATGSELRLPDKGGGGQNPIESK